MCNNLKIDILLLELCVVGRFVFFEKILYVLLMISFFYIINIVSGYENVMYCIYII